MNRFSGFIKGLMSIFLFIFALGAMSTPFLLGKNNDSNQNEGRDKAVKIYLKYKKLEDENTLLKQKVKQLEEKIAKITEDFKRLEKQNTDITQKLNRAEKELQLLRPEDLPEFKTADLQKYFRITRIFSVKTGNCFTPGGGMSCLYCKVKTGEKSFGYLVYKGNRVFKSAANFPGIYDNDGNRLDLVTAEAAKEIIAWEKKNPDAPIRLSRY